MIRPIPRYARTPLWALVMMACASDVMGQTGPGLMLVPLADEGTMLETRVDAVLFPEGESDGPGEPDVELSIVEFAGRVAPLGDRDALRIGMDLLHIELDSDDPALPERLADHSVAAGVGLGRTEDGWEFAVTGGAGFAGDLPFSDDEAVYGLGSFIAVRRIDSDTAWQFGLEYNGNRVIFPDIPLPFVAYSDKVSDQLSYTLGFPFSAVRWEPIERLVVTANAAPASVLNGGLFAQVDYEFVENLHVYAQYDARYEAFHLSDDVENRRLLYRDRSVEVGFRAELLGDWGLDGEMRLAVGYGFDREFERGFDARDTDEVRELTNEPYLRLGVTLRF